MNNLKFLLCDSVELENIGGIRSIKVDDLIDFGEDVISDFLLPFRISIDMLNTDDETKLGIKNFDLFFLRDKTGFLLQNEEKSYLEHLIESLKFFLSKEEIYSDIEKQVIYIGFESRIDRDNFDILADLILSMHFIEKIKIEKAPDFENERQRDIYYKILEGKKKRIEKESINYATMANTVMLGGKSFIHPNQIKQMTLYQLVNSYLTIMNIENYNNNFSLYLAGADLKKNKLDLTHWSNKIKL